VTVILTDPRRATDDKRPGHARDGQEPHAAGFTDAQAEALTGVVKQALDIDMSNIATKTDIADVRREMGDVKAELVKWFAQVATILAVPKLFPTAHP
jgi:hypothetical protein